MKSNHKLIAFTLAGALTLAGCGAATNSAPSPTTNAQAGNTAQTPSQSQASATDVKSGVAKMLSIASDLKKQIDAGDEAKAKVTGPQLEDAWHTFEDQVKQKYAEDYANVEKTLDPLVAGSKASPLDKQTLSKLDDQMIQVLNDLAKKAN